ncbi:MAG: alanine racemase [bacterium]
MRRIEQPITHLRLPTNTGEILTWKEYCQRQQVEDMPTRIRPPRTRLEINLQTMFENLAVVARTSGQGVGINAVIKHDAYGHGIQKAAEVFAQNAKRLCVATIGEARIVTQHLVKEGISLPPILCLYPINDTADLAWAVTNNVEITIDKIQDAKRAAKQAEVSGKKVKIHFMVDTGLFRFGSPPNEAAKKVAAITNLNNLEIIGIFSHFASAEDTVKGPNQLKCFIDTLKQIKESVGSTLNSIDIHMANSAALIRIPDSHNLSLYRQIFPNCTVSIRAGEGLYGYSSGATAIEGTQPALSLVSTVERVVRLEAGQCAGYSQRQSETARKLALIGFGNSVGANLRCLIAGHEVVQFGEPDSLITYLDYTGLRVRQNQQVVIIGEQMGRQITLEDQATWNNLSAHILLTRLSGIPQIYLKN